MNYVCVLNIIEAREKHMCSFILGETGIFLGDTRPKGEEDRTDPRARSKIPMAF